MKGMLFKPWQVKAIAANPAKEWQTRRTSGLKEINEHPDAWEYQGYSSDRGGYWFQSKPCGVLARVNLNRYHVGEVVYIKEAWRYFGGEEYEYQKDAKSVIYRDDALVNLDIYKWHNSRTMPAWAARSFIKILDVQACRTRGITPADCEAEGIIPFEWDGETYYLWAGSRDSYPTPQQVYFALYDSINGQGAHERNWDFKYTFKLIPRPLEVKL